jgi:phage terminase Nu1 subunit (DNA packaging protein)
MKMRAANAITKISKDTLKKIFITELQEKGITESKNGTKIDDLDYYELRHEVFLLRSRETNIENGENKWF